MKNNDGLTDEEQAVMVNLKEAYEKFMQLSKEHPDELRDFVDGIHRCQDVMAVRVCRREFPEGWPTYDIKKRTEEYVLSTMLKLAHTNSTIRQVYNITGIEAKGDSK